MRVKSVLIGTALAPFLFLGGCGPSSEAPPEEPAAGAVAMADAGEGGPTVEATADSADAKGFSQKVNAGGETGRFQFEYSWPAQVSAVPSLVARFDAERAAAYAKWRGEWDEAQEDTVMADCVSCRSRGYDKEWSVVTDLPRYLSLSASVYSYTGGAHGMTVYDALVWDREKEVAMKPIDMFRNTQVLDAAVQDDFCDQLDKARARKRGGPVKRNGDPFYDCIAPVANSTVILGSAGKQGFDRVGFLIPAYNAGPYAEGTYEVTLPVTPALLDTVKPEYVRAFQVR